MATRVILHAEFVSESLDTSRKWKKKKETHAEARHGPLTSYRQDPR